MRPKDKGITSHLLEAAPKAASPHLRALPTVHIMMQQPLFFISKDQDPTHSCKERTVGPYEM